MFFSPPSHCWPKELSSLTNEGASLAAMVLFARADNVSLLGHLLAPLVNPKSTTHATVQVAASGLTVHVSQGKVFMATARLDAGLFQEYRVLQEGLAPSFAVNLGTLVGVLQIFGPLLSTAAVLAWKGYGADLQVVLHEGAMRTECSLRTLETEEVSAAARLQFVLCHILVDTILNRPLSSGCR